MKLDSHLTEIATIILDLEDIFELIDENILVAPELEYASGIQGIKAQVKFKLDPKASKKMKFLRHAIEGYGALEMNNPRDGDKVPPPPYKLEGVQF